MNYTNNFEAVAWEMASLRQKRQDLVSLPNKTIDQRLCLYVINAHLIQVYSSVKNTLSACRTPCEIQLFLLNFIEEQFRVILNSSI